MRKNCLRRIFAACLAAVTIACMLPSAFAQDAPIAVVLDGQALSFADGVQPVIKNGRTYVPFRAIFEAMGAKVGWDGASKTVSAQRENTQASFVVGSTTVTVTEDGGVRTLQTDAAPYLSAAGHTLVPVRFAAQVFGADVGWDAAAETVLIVDTDKLRAQLTEPYSVMNRYLSFAVPSGVQSVNGSVSLNLTLGSGIKVPVQTSFYGLWGEKGARLTVRFQSETTLLQSALAADSGAVDSSLAKLLTEMNDVSFSCILNLDNDAFYLQSDTLTDENIPAGAWVRLPLDKTLGLLTGGRLNAAMLRALHAYDFAAYTAALAQNVELTSASADNPAAVRAVLEQQAKWFGDDVFQQDGNALLASSESADGSATALLRLTTDGDAVISAESQTALVRDTQIIYQQTAARNADGETTFSIVIGADHYQAELNGKMTMKASEESLVLKPEGKVVPE